MQPALPGEGCVRHSRKRRVPSSLVRCRAVWSIGHQSFVVSVDQLLTTRQAAHKLKLKIVDLNALVQETGRAVADKVGQILSHRCTGPPLITVSAAWRGTRSWCCRAATRAVQAGGPATQHGARVGDATPVPPRPVAGQARGRALSRQRVLCGAQGEMSKDAPASVVWSAITTSREMHCVLTYISQAIDLLEDANRPLASRYEFAALIRRRQALPKVNRAARTHVPRQRATSLPSLPQKMAWRACASRSS